MALDRLKSALSTPRPLLDAVGMLLVGRTQRAFQDQARAGNSWRQRAVPNRIGILEDLRAGQSPPERRWDPRPAAIDTGRLRASIAFRVNGNKVVVGSQLPYASDVQRGSTKTIALDGGLRRALAAWLKSLRGDRRDMARKAFGPLFSKGAASVRVPPRPFLAITDEDRKTIKDLALKFFRGGYLT